MQAAPDPAKRKSIATIPGASVPAGADNRIEEASWIASDPQCTPAGGKKFPGTINPQELTRPGTESP